MEMAITPAGKPRTFWENVSDVADAPLYNLGQLVFGCAEDRTAAKLALAERLQPGYGNGAGKSAREVLESHGYDWQTGKKLKGDRYVQYAENRS